MATPLKFNKDMLVAVFQDLRAAFPKLKMDLELTPAKVDINLDIPKQPGLVCDVNLHLKGEELHFSAGHFWLEWFPASEERVVDFYRDAVYNWLRGEYRILEYYRGDKIVKAELQCPLDNGDWKVIGTRSAFSLPFGGKVTTKELVNSASGIPGRAPN